jgi:hypothetical protein
MEILCVDVAHEAVWDDLHVFNDRMLTEANSQSAMNLAKEIVKEFKWL